MALQLYDSLERKLKPVAAHQPDGVVRFYNCGPTVYAPAHIGNFRTFVINDVIRRLLELEFGQNKVKHVRNLTDVDDKTIKRARDEGRPLAEVTKQWTDKFHADCAALNCLAPHVEPTATGHIHEQVDMIDVLMKKGHAYRSADGSVYFKVGSFGDYGKLSRVKERELKSGSAFAADADEKEDLSDFALWKAHKDDDGANAWESPWGRGRPGWHIECSAMSKKHLGETIDLHTGGVDLLFPHHENEIAQSECCNGSLFSHHWYHSEHLLVDGKKMSKSLGNLYTLDDLKKIMGPAYFESAIRLALMQGHPRKQLNFTTSSLLGANEALGSLGHWYDATKIRAKAKSGPTPRSAGNPSRLFDPVIAALEDDLNFPAALAALFAPEKTAEDNDSGDLLSFEKALLALGLKVRSAVQLEDDHRASEVAIYFAPQSVEAPAPIKNLAERRWAARTAKDWAAADALRKELAAAGWSMLDGKDGFKLEPLKK